MSTGIKIPVESFLIYTPDSASNSFASLVGPNITNEGHVYLNLNGSFDVFVRLNTADTNDYGVRRGPLRRLAWGGKLRWQPHQWDIRFGGVSKRSGLWSTPPSAHGGQSQCHHQLHQNLWRERFHQPVGGNHGVPSMVTVPRTCSPYRTSGTLVILSALIPTD
jgi:hypothetical protein